MFNIKNLTIKQIKGNKTLMDNFSVQFNANDKVVILGEEGTGKSSLLKVMAGIKAMYINYESEYMTEKAIVAYVSQIPSDERSTFDFIYDTDTYFDYQKYYELLDGFNIDEHLIDSRKFNRLSGGEKVKLSIIKSIMKNPDILLLDEPTNDLDLESIEYLEKLLQSLSIPILFASHDIRFIETVANRVIHFEQFKRRTESKVTLYNMDYVSFKTYRSSIIENHNIKANEEREQLEISLNRIEQIHDKVHSTLSKEKNDFLGESLKRKMRAIKSHEKKLDKKKDALTDFIELEEPIQFILNTSEKAHRSKVYIDLSLQPLQIEDNILSKSVRLNLIGNQKVAIVGNNGAGKSTLLKQVMKSLEESRIDYLYMPQNYQEIYDVSKTAVELLKSEGDKEDITQVMNYLGSLRFTFEEMHNPFSSLSGGQKAKLFFADMARKKLEILIMDEPTRNLSPLSMETLIEALKNFNGAILTVTHDRNLIDAVFDVVYELTYEGLKQIK